MKFLLILLNLFCLYCSFSIKRLKNKISRNNHLKLQTSSPLDCITYAKCREALKYILQTTEDSYQFEINEFKRLTLEKDNLMRLALKKYTGYDYTSINWFLKSNIKAILINDLRFNAIEYLEILINIISKVLKEEEMTIYKTLYRSTSGIISLKTGDIVKNTAFISTSHDENKARLFSRIIGEDAIILKFEDVIKRHVIGREISQYSEKEKEKEVLLDINQYWRVEEETDLLSRSRVPKVYKLYKQKEGKRHDESKLKIMR